MIEHTQAETELQVFQEFAAAVERPILVETISSRKPPEPDIVCEVAGEGSVGFELTELVDFAFMARLDLGEKTHKALVQFWKEKLSESQSESFRTKYKNSSLYFRFGSEGGLLKRKALFHVIFEELLALPNGFIGEVLRYDKRFLPTLELVRVSQSLSVGPNIQLSNFGWTGDPTEDTISHKLSKIYQCTYPVELLAYIHWDVLPPEGAWRASLEKVATALKDSQFRRLWVFDRSRQQVLAILP